MRSKLTLLMALALMAFSITQCKKKTDEPVDEEETPAATTGPNSVADIIAANGAATNNFTIDASIANTLSIASPGNPSAPVKLDIPASAFTNSASSVISAGVVTVSVKVILTKPEIIFSGAGANSTNARLVSTKGCVKATASQNTQSLRLNNSTNFYVCIPDANVSPSAQKKYYAPKITATDSTKKWALGTDVSDVPFIVYSGTNHHRAKLDSLKWLNVGVQDTAAVTRTAVTVSVNPMFTSANTMIYLSYDGELTVGAMYQVSSGTFRIQNIPVGKSVNLVGIAAVNGQYYAAVLPTTVTNSTPISLNLTAMSQSAMKSLINTVP